MNPAPTHAPVDLFTTLLQMRQAVYGAWQHFTQQMPDADLTPEDCWLLLQLTAGPATMAELEATLALFVERPAPLVAKAMDRGWVSEQTVENRITYSLTAEAKTFFQQLLPIAQAANAGWREALAEQAERSGAPNELDLVLAVLQGRRSTPA